MKKIIAFKSIMTLGSGAGAGSGRNLSEKLLRTFRESFPHAYGTNWKEFQNSYAVDFLENNVQVHVVYAKNGELFRSIRYYEGQDLPYYLQTVIHKRYPEKRVFGVVEVADARGVVYLLRMQDGKILVTIKMASQGKLELVEKYVKL